ncbi:MoxR family ATPase, partial [Clostridium botulinum]|nr:MoxR family ATPase [Clostridium botulinum]
QYEVVDMDPAQEDRFVWLEMQSDVKEWIKWGMSIEENIHEHIIEFISTFPQYLHTPNSNESIKATPRSRQRISKAYEVYLNNKDKYDLNIFLNTVRGNVGSNICNDFADFILHIRKPLIKVEDLFENEILSVDLKEKLENENHSRLYILAKNAILFVERNSSEKNLILFSKVLDLYPR